MWHQPGPFQAEMDQTRGQEGGEGQGNAFPSPAGIPELGDTPGALLYLSVQCQGTELTHRYSGTPFPTDSSSERKGGRLQTEHPTGVAGLGFRALGFERCPWQTPLGCSTKGILTMAGGKEPGRELLDMGSDPGLCQHLPDGLGASPSTSQRQRQGVLAEG